MKFLFLLGLFFSVSAFSFTPPDFQGNVLDEAGVLDEKAKSELHAAIQSARDRAGIWSAIYIIPTLNGESIEDAAEKTFRHWKLGQEGKDNGLLFMVAVNDRKMRIEVGYGLEGTITDLASNVVINENLKPEFKKMEYAAGISNGLDRLVKFHLKEEAPIETGSDGDLDISRGKLIACFILNFFFIICFWVMYLYRKISGRKLKLKWFGAQLAVAHGLALVLSCFFVLFWGFAPLFFIVPFNAVFSLCFIGLLTSESLKVLISESNYATWVIPWLKYDQEYVSWKAEFIKAEKMGSLTNFLSKNPLPIKPGSFLKMGGNGKWSVGSGSSSSHHSSSSSSSSSSRSSSSSSSGGGRSGGGGSSGSW